MPALLLFQPGQGGCAPAKQEERGKEGESLQAHSANETVVASCIKDDAGLRLMPITESESAYIT